MPLCKRAYSKVKHLQISVHQGCREARRPIVNIVRSQPIRSPESGTMKSGASPASGSWSGRNPRLAKSTSSVRRSVIFCASLVISAASPQSR
jgi:hypothetical protein